jgi:hypothetical protein
MIDVCFVTFDHFGPRGVFQGDWFSGSAIGLS